MKEMTEKKKYVAPLTELCENYCQPVMINIGSGETIPEDSDANVSIFDEDGEDYVNSSFNVWDEL